MTVDLVHFAALPDLRAAQEPDGAAIKDTRVALSNRDLLERVCAAAEQLHDLGIGRGDVLALQLPNRVELVVLLFAAWRLGATVTPANPALTPVELAHQLSDSQARLLVREDQADPVAGTAVLAVSDLRTTPCGAPPSVVADPDELALLIYTSGTTGAPKGVMLDHANLTAMAAMGRDALAITDTDRSLLILPLFHVNGIVVSVLLPLVCGGSVVIASRFNPSRFFSTVETERPTYFSGVPTIYSMLADLARDTTPDTSSIRFAVCGAAPAPPGLLERFEQRYGVPVVEGYGLSEATCGSTINPLDGPRKAGTVGLPFAGQQVRIGADGEIAVKGPNVMRGYLGRPEETAAVLSDGWLLTGDVGQLDAEGYLTILGRSKEMIIRGGENIYPKEIEDVLTGDSSVHAAAVIGVPDATWGEVVVAFVQAEPGVSPDPAALMKRCTEHLSSYKRPLEIRVVDALPRNAVGKVVKPALRELLSAGR